MPLGESFSEHIHYESRRTKLPGGKPAPRVDWQPSLIFLVIFAGFIFLLAGLVRLQVFQGRYFSALAGGNRTQERVVHAPRGSIYDRHNTLLAGSVGATRQVICQPDCTGNILSREEALKKESEPLPEGTTLETDSQRRYHWSESMGSVIGYISEINAEELAQKPGYLPGDRVGRTGVEETYESILKGIDGKELVEVDALGRKRRVLGVVPPKSGQDVQLTIDAQFQAETLAAMDGKKGAVVVSDPRTGQILALVSSPSYDLNIFTDFSTPMEIRDDQIGRIFSDQNLPMFNRAVSAIYPPGSTFKIITAVAGLETGKITETTEIDDPGILEIGPYKFPNWKFLRDGGTQGTLDVVGALRVSNDIFFYRAGEYTGLDELEVWAKKFNLGSKLGIDLPGESGGLFPGKDWREVNAREWYLGDTYHLAIGQGDLLVTPLQVNSWTNVIANGGRLCRPHVLGSLSSLGDLCRDLGISQKTLGLVKKGLTAACNPGGTAWPLFNFKVNENPVQLACKTGTAEFGPADRFGRHKTHAWLTAFGPADDPEISVAVIVEGGGEGSDVAAPIVKKVMEGYFEK